MLTKKELESMPQVNEKIRGLIEKLNSRGSIAAIRYDKELVQESAKTSSAIEALMVWRESVELELDAAYAERDALEEAIYDFLLQLPDLQDRQLIKLYCIKCYDFRRCAEMLQMSPTTVWRRYQMVLRNNNM